MLEQNMFERWKAFLEPTSPGLPNDEAAVEAAFQILARRYQEQHRHYHTLAHIHDCLDRLDEYRQATRSCSPAEDLVIVEMALWWHDAVYDSRSHTNELDSAHLAKQVCILMQFGQDAAHRISECILATRHQDITEDADAKLVCDVDLASLGYSWETFCQNSAQIRDEYHFVPSATYNKKRAEILQGFLNRSRIYSTEYFREAYEPRARENLRRAIEGLQS